MNHFLPPGGAYSLRVLCGWGGGEEQTVTEQTVLWGGGYLYSAPPRRFDLQPSFPAGLTMLVLLLLLFLLLLLLLLLPLLVCLCLCVHNPQTGMLCKVSALPACQNNFQRRGRGEAEFQRARCQLQLSTRMGLDVNYRVVDVTSWGLDVTSWGLDVTSWGVDVTSWGVDVTSWGLDVNCLGGDI